MRAKEILSEDKNVTINIPITITIPSSGGDPVVATPGASDAALPDEPVMVFPLQQELELRKRSEGKRSAVISQILDDNGAFGKSTAQEESFNIAEDFDALSEEYAQQSKPI